MALSLAPGTPGSIPSRYWPLLPPLLAVAAVGLGLLLGWHGVDLAAAIHRVALFRRDGLTLWDDTWYGGQWTLDYSVAFAPVAATVGLPLLALASAAASAFAFDRIVTPRLGTAGRLGVAVFAISTVVETAIGQLPFLAGESFALGAIWFATRRRWPAAWALAFVSSLFSPLAGAFAAFAAVAWVVAEGRNEGRRWSAALAGVAVAAALPVAATTVLFPGEGHMPFQAVNCAWDVAIAAAVFALTPRQHRVLRAGIALYAVVLVASCAIRSPVGGNAGRLEDCLALPLVITMLWSRRKLWLVALAVPIAMSGWAPAWAAVTRIPSQPSAHQTFFTPLVSWLRQADHDGLDGRVEVVPTADHGEAAWVSPYLPVARGWERQTDVSQNPIFYIRGKLDDSTYRAWLLANGVRYVALANAPLDYAGITEGRLVAAGVPGLQPVWHDRDWRVWKVGGSSGLASGGATVLSLGAEGVSLRVPRSEAVTVSVRWNQDWRITAGRGCLFRTPGGWTGVDTAGAGPLTLGVHIGSPTNSCPATDAAR